MFMDRKTDNPIFYKFETYLDHLLMPEIYVLSNFVKTVTAILEIFKICAHGEADRQPDYLQGWDQSRLSSHAQNISNTKFCENH